MGRKNRGKKEPKKFIYIVGEGITEQYYFQHLKRLQGYTCTIQPRLFGNTSIFDIEKKITALLKEDVEIICVFDADVSSRDAVEKERLENLKRKYATNDKVIICDSLQCIEYWFILHYENTCPGHSSGTQTVNQLKKHISEYNKSEQYLKRSSWVEEMTRTRGSLSDAYQRAVEHEDGLSYTKIYKAIDKLDETK
ncbi:MAG: RloB family protein [Tannerellaceae bacterium]|nr:RloB family protein [Tannerellaceae bacterium]